MSLQRDITCRFQQRVCEFSCYSASYSVNCLCVFLLLSPFFFFFHLCLPLFITLSFTLFPCIFILPTSLMNLFILSILINFFRISSPFFHPSSPSSSSFCLLPSSLNLLTSFFTISTISRTASPIHSSIHHCTTGGQAASNLRRYQVQFSNRLSRDCSICVSSSTVQVIYFRFVFFLGCMSVACACACLLIRIEPEYRLLFYFPPPAVKLG